jgi:hypothetical protein
MSTASLALFSLTTRETLHRARALLVADDLTNRVRSVSR